MKDAIAMADRLRAELNQMLSEHREIVARLKTLTEAALKENKLDYVQFAEKLSLHAQTEEEVLYPAAILVGEYLKLQSEK
jgi:iron-sulfur cluster repair protein YtfE (RIC family)